MKKNKKFQCRFGDTGLCKANNNTIEIGLNTLDEIEYDCWKLIKKYGDLFDIDISAEDNIDFYSAKTVQDAILELFKDAGFEFKHTN